MEDEKKEQKDGENCSACGQPGADKKFGGQYFHKPCLRAVRKQAKSMFK